MTATIYNGDYGTVLRATVKDENQDIIDVSAATAKTIRLTDPSGTSTDHTAAFETDGSDGVITYTTLSGDIDASGRWRIQAIVTLSATRYFSASISEFRVNDVLPAP